MTGSAARLRPGGLPTQGTAGAPTTVSAHHPYDGASTLTRQARPNQPWHENSPLHPPDALDDVAREASHWLDCVARSASLVSSPLAMPDQIRHERLPYSRREMAEALNVCKMVGRSRRSSRCERHGFIVETRSAPHLIPSSCATRPNSI